MTDTQTSDRDVNRAIRSWLHEDRHEDASRIAGAVLDQVEATPGRRATWWPAPRTESMNKLLTVGLGAAAVVVLALLLGTQLLTSPSGFGGPADEPSPSPEASVAAPSASVAAGLPAGPHVLWETDTGMPITVSIAAPDWDGEPGVLFYDESGADPPDGAGMIGFDDREYYVYGDPCNWSTTKPDSPATTVEELVDALANQGSREASAPEEITVDGYEGKKIILHMAENVDLDACDEGTFALFGVPGEDRARYSQGPGQVEEVWAVDVDGLIVVLIGTYYADTPQNAVDELHAIIGSMTFGE